MKFHRHINEEKILNFIALLKDECKLSNPFYINQPKARIPKYFFPALLLMLGFLGRVNGQDDQCITAPKLLVFDDCRAISGSTKGLSAVNRNNACGGATDDDGWYQFVAETETTTIEVFSEPRSDMGLSIYLDCNTEVDCIDITEIGQTERITFRTIPGEDYFIQIYDVRPGGGDFLICVNTKANDESRQSDCVGAEVICKDDLITFQPVGFGIDDFKSVENQEGCIAARENRSAWYYFEFAEDAPTDLILTFTITPKDNTDYDFAIFGPNVDCDRLGYPIRCSWAAFDCLLCPQTGLGSIAKDASEDAFGDGFVAPLTVQPGEGYYLLVDNYFQNTMGFTLNWSGSAAPFLNCEAEVPCGVFAEAGNPITYCNDTQLKLNGGEKNGLTSVEYLWEQLSGDPIDFENIKDPETEVNLPDSSSGSFNLALTAFFNDCSHTDVLTLTKDCDVDSNNLCKTPIIGNFELLPPNCQDPSSGVIQLVSVDVGNSPYQYQLNSGAFQSHPIYSNLEAGQYQFSIKDGNGCIADTILELSSKPFYLSLELGPDVVIDQGDTIELSIITDILPKEIERVSWSETVDCDTFCLNAKIALASSKVLKATIHTIQGCEVSNEIKITVIPKTDIYIPTSFSPNGDNINDWFTIFSDSGISNIKSLQIFDRWGNLLFRKNNFPPNVENQGWDGTFQGKILQRGIYLFQATIELPEKEIALKSGEILLMR